MAKFCTHTRADHMQGHVLGFMSIGVVVTKIMTFFKNACMVGQHFCCDDLRSLGRTVGSRPIPAGWLAGCSRLTAAACCMLGRYSDVADVSLSDWPLRVY